MTHASDLAKLAETFIDRYLVECDARREAEAALAKSEEERATQSANLAASLAECETLKAARAEMDRREKQDAWDAGYIRGRDTVVESDRERERLTDEIASLREANVGLGAEAGKLKARITDLKADLDAVAGSLGVESTREAILRTIERVRADIKRKDREWSEMRDERDALRRAEVGKGAGDATDEEMAREFVDALHAHNGTWRTWAETGETVRASATAAIAAVVRPRLAALQAKVDALTVERDEKDADLKAALTALDEAKATGEGRVGDDLHLVFNSRPLAWYEVPDGHRDSHLFGDARTKRSGEWFVSYEGMCPDEPTARAAVERLHSLVTGRTLAQPRASMLTAMAEVGMLVGLDVPQDKTDREVWNVFGNRVREEVKARLAAGADADRRAREALDRVVGAYAKGRADAMRTLAQPADAGRDAVVEMRLCEASRVMLRPDTLYRFTVDPACDRCVAAAQSYRGEAPTSPAKRGDRYVVRESRQYIGGQVRRFSRPEYAERYAADCNADPSIFSTGSESIDIVNGYTWAVVDTQPVAPPGSYAPCPCCTRELCPHFHKLSLSDGDARRAEQECDDIARRIAPQPSPRAVGVDAERLAVAFDNALRMIAGSASAMATAMNRPNMTEAMRRALATIGAQPVVALTIDALHTARVAAVRDAGGIEAHMSTERMFRHLTASGPVAIPAGIDREALIAARTCVMAHGGPSMSRMVQAIDGVIRAGDAGKADAVTVREIVFAWDWNRGKGFV